MHDEERPADGGRDALDPLGRTNSNEDSCSPADDLTQQDVSDPQFDESLTEELAALIDDGRNYAAAELAFQKTRAALVGRNIGMALVFVVIAVILLHIALLALAVGLVIALQPLVTIWGAIAIVVGALLLSTFAMLWLAKGHGERLSALFEGPDSENAS